MGFAPPIYQTSNQERFYYGDTLFKDNKINSIMKVFPWNVMCDVLLFTLSIYSFSSYYRYVYTIQYIILHPIPNVSYSTALPVQKGHNSKHLNLFSKAFCIEIIIINRISVNHFRKKIFDSTYNSTSI